MPATASEADRVTEARPGATATLHPDGSALVHVPDVVLPGGWTAPTTAVWWVLSPGYPSAQPDCFFADAHLMDKATSSGTCSTRLARRAAGLVTGGASARGVDELMSLLDRGGANIRSGSASRE